MYFRTYCQTFLQSLDAQKLERGCALQGKDVKSFQRLMQSAEQFGMQKVLACCEYCIAMDRSKKFDGFLQQKPPGLERSAECIRLITYLREWPVKLWSPEVFLEMNLNKYQYRA